jgi:hypothetical protein
VAVTSAGAVAAVYAVMAYIMKMSLVFSMAWKAAAGVAAAEGLALGSWSYGAVRDKEAATGALAAAAAQHAREIATLQSLLRQEEYRSRHVVRGWDTMGGRWRRHKGGERVRAGDCSKGVCC